MTEKGNIQIGKAWIRDEKKNIIGRVTKKLQYQGIPFNEAKVWRNLMDCSKETLFSLDELIKLIRG